MESKTGIVTKKIVYILAFTICILFIIILLLIFTQKDSLDDFLNKVEKAFGLSSIQYSDILYYMPFQGGPLGEGDAYLVVRLTDEYADIFEDSLDNASEIYDFPMEDEIKYYSYNAMRSDRSLEKLPILETGKYAFYSKVEEQILSTTEILTDSYYMSSFLYIQYDDVSKVLYIWDYS